MSSSEACCLSHTAHGTHSYLVEWKVLVALCFIHDSRIVLYAGRMRATTYCTWRHGLVHGLDCKELAKNRWHSFDTCHLVRNKAKAFGEQSICLLRSVFFFFFSLLNSFFITAGFFYFTRCHCCDYYIDCDLFVSFDRNGSSRPLDSIAFIILLMAYFFFLLIFCQRVCRERNEWNKINENHKSIARPRPFMG